MPPVTISADGEAFRLKKMVDAELSEEDGFESHLFTVGAYNKLVAESFHLPYEEDTVGLLLLSTPNMFDVSYKKWLLMKREELGSVDAIAENIPSPIQAFMDYRLEPITRKLDEGNLDYELFFDHSLYANRKPKILLQTCGHVSGATYYYKPSLVSDENWPPRSPGGKKQFIGLCLHPIYGGHFAFRCVFLFPKIHLPNFTAPEPISILKSKEEIRQALERFNYNYWDSKFRDFGSPLKRYSPIQVEYFGMLPSDRWNLIKRWCDMP